LSAGQETPPATKYLEGAHVFKVELFRRTAKEQAELGHCVHGMIAASPATDCGSSCPR
jgi:hypothetical protein